MKKLSLLLFFFSTFWAIGQQSITDKLSASIKTGGAGVAYFTINYKAGSYQTTETDLVTINASDTNNITYTLRCGISDTGKNSLDTNITLSSSQLTMLNSFYQSAGAGSNPDPAISNSKTGASGTLTVSLCCGDAIDMTYNTTIHISLGRYLLSNWTKWN